MATIAIKPGRLRCVLKAIREYSDRGAMYPYRRKTADELRGLGLVARRENRHGQVGYYILPAGRAALAKARGE